MIFAKKSIFLLMLAVASLSFSQNSEVFNGKPVIDGTIRGKYEYFTELDSHRFQVRNARFGFRGGFNSMTSYKAEIDLSDEGRTRMLDAYIQYRPQKWWDFTIGQQKVPFSTDNLRSPHNIYFANRSFMAKQLTNLRDVGATLHFHNGKAVPFHFYTGVYNGMGLYTQDKTIKSNQLSYAARLVIEPSKNFSFSLNANTINPGEIRMNFFNAGAMYHIGNFHIEGEALYKTYEENDLINPCETHGFVIFGAYDIKTPKLKTITKITPLLRYDGMSENLRYEVKDANTVVTKLDGGRNRITGGVTISLNKPFVNDIRLNYEHYEWTDGSKTDSKFVAEFVVRF